MVREKTVRGEERTSHTRSPDRSGIPLPSQLQSSPPQLLIGADALYQRNRCTPALMISRGRQRNRLEHLSQRPCSASLIPSSLTSNPCPRPGLPEVCLMPVAPPNLLSAMATARWNSCCLAKGQSTMTLRPRESWVSATANLSASGGSGTAVRSMVAGVML